MCVCMCVCACIIIYRWERRLEDSTGSSAARAESSDTLISVTHAKLITSGIIALHAGASSLSQLLLQIRQHDRQT